jgi:hypothetical protein
MGVVPVTVTMTVMRVCRFHSSLPKSVRARRYFRCALTSAGVVVSPVLLAQLLRV